MLLTGSSFSCFPQSYSFRPNQKLGRLFLEISQSRLNHNLKIIQEKVYPAKVTLVLKADAYGLGIENLIPIIKKNKVEQVAFASLGEIKKFISLYQKYLAKSKSTSTQSFLPQIILLGDFFPFELSELVRTQAVIPVTNLKAGKLIERYAFKKKMTIDITLVIDSGMGRLGVHASQAVSLFKELSQLKGLRVKQVYSHFPNADQKNDLFTQTQIKKFKKIKSKIENLSKTKIYFNIANSFGAFNYPDSHFDLVRLGIGIYGVYHHFSLPHVFELKSYLLSKRELPIYSGIGYNHTYKLKRKSWIGTIPAGYADGIPFALGVSEGVSENSKKFNYHKKNYVIIHGEKAPIIGKINMDYLTVDLTDLNHQKINLGDPVILLGGNKDNISVEDWSQIKKTHPYDILTSLNTPRIEKILID